MIRVISPRCSLSLFCFLFIIFYLLPFYVLFPNRERDTSHCCSEVVFVLLACKTEWMCPIAPKASAICSGKKEKEVMPRNTIFREARVLRIRLKRRTRLHSLEHFDIATSTTSVTTPNWPQLFFLSSTYPLLSRKCLYYQIPCQRLLR